MGHENSCFFTGHRVIPGDKLPSIKVKLDREIENMINKGVTDFWCGGALGFDMLAAERVILLRKKYGNVRLLMALPCRDQAARWRDTAEVRRYNRLLKSADYCFYVTEQYEEGCMHRRNRFLAERADFGIAYRTHYHGGTDYTVKYAQELGRSIVFIEDVVKPPLPFMD